MNPRDELARQVTRARRAWQRTEGDPGARKELGRTAVRRARKKVTAWRHGVRTTVALPAADIPDGPVERPDLRVAVILDPFSEMAFRYEWDQVLITPYGWRAELEARRPAMLFVESAWQGNRGAWRLAMSTGRGPSAELVALVAWCREQGIPTVFWNKEDPPNYDRFIETARLFDQVFTVDADKIPTYVADLGHEKVGLLPFAAQPRIHNPVQRGPGRVREVAFAGTYFADKHPERRAQMDVLLGAALEHELEIWSRQQGDDPRYRFPARFARRIVGSLPYEQMLSAYTAYKVFLNVNSVTESPTMGARRLFELSAAQTAILSGPAASIEPFFGGTITVATEPEAARRDLKVLLEQDAYRDRLALRAHRRVFDEHLYRHRVETVLASTGVPAREPDRSISAVVATMRPHELERVAANLARQRHTDRELVLVTHGFAAPEGLAERWRDEHGLEAVTIVPAEGGLTLGACMNLGVAAASGRYVTKMDDDNYYGPGYLQDLVRAFDYTDAAVVGKWAHHVHLAATDATVLRFAHAEHRYTRLVQGGTIMTARDTLADIPFRDVPRAVDTTFLEAVHEAGGRVYSADRFEYVSRRAASTEGHTWGIGDLELLSRSSQLLFYGDPTAHVTV